MNLWNKLMCYSRRHSPWLFHMNGGSCNGCDIELIASLTPRYDAEQLGVRLEGSPRHADILCITGPITHNATNAIKTVYDQVCGPKAVIAIGSCPATTNVFIDSRTLEGPLSKHIPVDVFVPGCPPRPDAIIQGVAKAAEILAERAGKKQPIAPVVPVVMPLVGPGCGGACACGTGAEAKEPEIVGKSGEMRSSGAEALIDPVGFIRGMNPPPPSGLNSSATSSAEARNEEVQA